MTNNRNKARSFAITGGTLTGNHGAEGMLRVVVSQLTERYPGCEIHILTYYPKDDSKVCVTENCCIYSATPLRLVIDWLPSAILHWLAEKILGRGIGVLPFAKVLNAEAVIDIAGVSFIDGREKFLPYNALTLLPFIVNGVPVFKLSQAIGPISSFWNRMVSKLVLPRVNKIFARGEYTYSNLEESGIPNLNYELATDTAFLLPYNSTSNKDSRLIGIVPSSLLLSKNPSYADDLSAVTDWLAESGYKVVLITHSWRLNTNRERNNDIIAAKSIISRMTHKKAASIVGPGLFASELKAEISSCRFILTSRFHGMIASLGTYTPVVVLGWSHKYAEVMARFGLEHYCMKYKNGLVEKIKPIINRIIKNEEKIISTIEGKLPEIKFESRKQFEQIFKFIDNT